MVALDSEQRVVDDRIIGVMPDQHPRSHDLLTIIGKRRNNLTDTLHDPLPALHRLDWACGYSSICLTGQLSRPQKASGRCLGGIYVLLIENQIKADLPK